MYAQSVDNLGLVFFFENPVPALYCQSVIGRKSSLRERERERERWGKKHFPPTPFLVHYGEFLFGAAGGEKKSGKARVGKRKKSFFSFPPLSYSISPIRTCS